MNRPVTVFAGPTGLKEYIFEEDFSLPVTLYQQKDVADPTRPFLSKPIAFYVLDAGKGRKEPQLGSAQIDLASYATPEVLSQQITIPIAGCVPANAASGPPHLTLSGDPDETARRTPPKSSSTRLRSSHPPQCPAHPRGLIDASPRAPLPDTCSRSLQPRVPTPIPPSPQSPCP